MQGLDEEAADVRAGLAEGLDLGFEAGAVGAQQEEAEGQQRHAEQEQLPIEPQEQGDGAGEREHVAEPGQGCFGGDALDLADVVVDAADDFAQAGAGIEARRELLQVAVEGQPHVEEDLGGDAGVAQAADQVQQERDGGEDGEGDADLHEGVPVAAEEGLIDERLGEIGLVEGEAGAGGADDENEDEAPPVRDDVGTKGGHRARCSCPCPA